jgi:hypothetical protein
MKRALSAINEIARLDGRECDADRVREVAAWARADALALARPLFEKVVHAQALGLPDPVLAVTHVGHLEVPWTNYLFRGLGGEIDTDRSPGNALATALHTWAGGSPAEGVEIRKEMYLGTAPSREDPHRPCPCKHGCSVDLVLIGEEVAVCIEHKINAGASDWACVDCGGSQSDAYRALFDRWAHRKSLEPHFVYLSPTGRDVAGWTSLSHAELARILATALRQADFPRFGERYRIAAMLVDLATSILGGTDRTLELAARWENAPDNPALALALFDRMKEDPVLPAILEVLHG